MNDDLRRRIKKAKRAQAKRFSSLRGGKKKCKIGKSCGATCIARHEICAVELTDSVSSALKKTFSMVSSRKIIKGDQLSTNFSKHLEENSFQVPGRSFTGKDLANMVNQAAEGLTGEARENIDKLRKFVVDDKQVLFVSTNSNDAPFKGRGIPKWVQSSKYLEMLDKSIDFVAWGKTLGIFTSWSNSFSKAMGEVEDRIRSMKMNSREYKLEQLKLMKNIKMRQKRGWKTEDQEWELEHLREKRMNAATKISSMLRNFADVVAVSPGSGASTNPGGRLILMADNKVNMDTPYSRSQKIDSARLQSRVANVIDMRGKANEFTDIATLDKDTFTFSGKRGERGNDRILMNYVHEVGHQIQFRGGVSDPPKNSPSVTRGLAPGITRYAHESKLETFAEAYVAYTFNPKALRDHDEPLYNWVKETVDKALPNAGTGEGMK